MKEAMQRATIATIGQFVGQTVQLEGWVYNARSGGKLGRRGANAQSQGTGTGEKDGTATPARTGDL